MKRLLAVLAAVCALGAALAAIPALAATKTAAVKDSYFAPKTLTVRKGTTVKWVWKRTRLAHNVAVRKGPQRFRSGPTKRKGSFAFKFTRAGVYRIHCEIHPGMDMTVRVRR
jgi:plastocyanin